MTLAYLLIHTPGAAGLLLNFVIFLILAAILFLVFKEVAATFNVNPRIVNLIGLLLFLVIILSLFTGCSTAQRAADEKAIKAELANTDVTAGVSYDGVTARVSRSNGRNAVNVDVDPKEVVNAISR